MEPRRVDRKLSAILAADVVGYSHLMGGDEEGTLARLTAHRRELFDPTIAKYRGRIFKTTGDGLLAEFASVVDAVLCSAEVQSGMIARNAGLPDRTRLDFRIGLHVGDIIQQDDDLFGDGVNIAARLEGIAEPGGVCVSRRVQEDAAGKVDLTFEDIGERVLKNIERPVRVYRLRIAKAAIRPVLSLPDKPSIAVLPFLNMSGDTEQEYFSDGISDDIITALSKLRSFFVIARNSTFAYKGKTPDVRIVARDLGVRYVLEGSVRRAGDRLRVTSQLIDATNGAHVWAEKYDRAVIDIFEVQDEITENVVAAIEPQLYAAETLRLLSKPPESLDAWGYVMRAMPHIQTWGGQESEEALTMLKRAIEIDPTYARANSLLAYAYATRSQVGWDDPTNTLETASALVRRAIEQDWEDPWAHLAAGYIHLAARRHQEAVEELKEAIDRNPSFALAHVILGAAYAYGANVDDALRHLALARRLSPRDDGQAGNFSSTGLCYLVAGRYAEAVEQERRAVQLRPHYGTAWRTLAAANGLLGDIDAAAAALTEACRIQPNLSIDWVEKFYPLVDAGLRARYIEGLRKAGLH